MRALPVLLAAAVLLGPAAPAGAVPASGHHRCAPPATTLPSWARYRHMTVVNDSVLLSGEHALRAGMPCWHIRLVGRPALMLDAAERQLRQAGRHVAPLVVLGVGYNTLWERHRRRFAVWSARFDRQANRLLATLRRLGARQFVWVTLRHADRANTSPSHWGELGLYSWYFPYVNERLRLLAARRHDLVLADWSKVGDRRGITYDSIHLNTRGGRLMQRLIARTIAAEAQRQAAAPAARSAQNVCDIIRRAAPAHRHGAPRPPLVVGDSSSLLAAAPLARLGIEADARACRQVGPAVDILAARRHAGVLPRVAVLAVGANGSIPRSQLDRALRVMGPRRKLGLVTTANPASSAAAMRSFHAAHPDRTILIDWAATGIPYRYGGDGVHIGASGEAVMARYIARRIHPYTPPRRRIPLTTDPAAAKACATVRRAGGVVAVYVVRGSKRIVCSAARALVRSADPAALRDYAWYDWRFVGSPPWTDVFVRHDSRVIVAARRPPA